MEYDAHGNRTETILGDEFYDYFRFIEHESFEHEFLEHGLLEREWFERDAYYEEPVTASNSGARSVFVPRFLSPETGALVGGQFFVTTTAHRFVVLRVIDLPWSLSGVDVFFTNALGDDKTILWGVHQGAEVRYSIRFPREAYGARVASRTGSGTATLWFFAAGNPVSINLNSNGGSVNPSRIDAFPGFPIFNLPTPTRFNRSFVGWFNTSFPGVGTRFTPESLAPNINSTLTARWHEPSRHTGSWWPATNSPGITPISFQIERGVGGVWLTAINNGIRNWNNRSHMTRVSFQSLPSSNNLVKVDSPSDWPATRYGVYAGWFGNQQHTTRFTITIHATNILNRQAMPLINVTVEEFATFVMAHESGHVVGLADNPTGDGSSDSIMSNRSLSSWPLNSLPLSPSSFDITSVNMLYN